MSDLLAIRDTGHVRTITLNRPEKKNALSGELSWGIVGAIDAAVAARLEAYCQSLCAWSPITLRLLKRGMVRAAASTDMEQQLRYEVANIRMAFASEDGQEARAAFLGKRQPVFQGR